MKLLKKIDVPLTLRFISIGLLTPISINIYNGKNGLFWVLILFISHGICLELCKRLYNKYKTKKYL